LGTGVVVPPVDQLFLKTNANDPATSIDVIIRAISTQHQQLRKQGKPLTSLDETRSELEAALAEFRQSRFPLYQRLGVAPPAPGAPNR
jgi:hypothetical protein